ncbi:MAG: CDP-glucose 4,6-dehydratase [Acidimicrobiales bacterium]|nr:CDP-glucose 4,6-dehydratase [Acidimicrobiales bacterium]
MTLSRAFWADRRVLVTGHTGFKGAWLAALLRSLGAEVSGLALESDARSAYGAIDGDSFVRSTIGDIRDRATVQGVFREQRPEVVLHLAAQALVRRSYAEPVETFDVNVVGTAAVLDAAVASPGVRVVVVVTSDKVYANDGSGRPFIETDRLGGGDPYSASKSAAEMVVGSWQHRLGTVDGPAVVAARAGNVIGGGDQAADRLLPDIFRAVEADRPVEIRNPDAVRPWQFVVEPVAGYLAYAEAAWNDRAATPPALNFGPGEDSCWPVRRVVDAVTSELGIEGWCPAPGAVGEPEATLLRLDSSLATRSLGWRPVLPLATALRWTVDWYRAERAGEPLADLVSTQLDRYQGLISP